jgi:hypothetical protein
MRTILLSVTLLSILLSCETESIYNKADLLGTWNCYKWDDNGEMNDISKGNVNFTFEQDKYMYKGGVHKEQGSWKLKGLNLVTQVEGLLPKEVEIKRLSQDTLIIDMVDNGIPMTMYLAKE